MIKIKEILKWRKSAAGKISTILFGISVVMLVIACSSWGNFSDRIATNINNILIGIATNLLGIIVTVSFVQYFIDKQDEQEEKNEERNLICKYNRVMSLFLKKYKKYFNCVVTPIGQRSKMNALQLRKTFAFHDMRDMYKQTLYLSEGFYEPSIVLFYGAEDDLRNYMIKMLENIEFKYHEDLYNILLEFVELSQSIDVRGSLLDDSLIKKYNKSILETIEKYIRDEEKYNWVAKADEGKLDSNIMLPYVHFYWLLQKEADLLIRYETCISKLAN